MWTRFWIFLIALFVTGALGLLWMFVFLSDGSVASPINILLKMLGISVGTFVSEDLACIGAGLLASTGELNLLLAVFAAYMGILVGDILIFAAGYFIGQPLLKHRWARFFVSPRAVTRAQGLFQEHGLWIILATRFLPGTRTATYFAGGSLHAPFLKFVGAFALAAAAWTPLLVGLSFLVGQSLLQLYSVYEAFALPAILAAALVLYFIFHYGLPMLSWKGRRRLKGKWIRATKWEFWPWWQVYWLVVLYILFLGLVRYRRPTLFTAVNPCMPHGGFLGESKGDILEGLAGSGAALPAWARIEELSCDERFATYRRAMVDLNLTYPVVLKPDEGQRGQAVAVIRNEQAANEWLSGSDVPAILQQYVPGREYGVFYVRRPGEETGRIVSVTIKEQLHVKGNGRDSLETLILAHPRAIAMLDTFLYRFEDELDRVPSSGEIIELGELGTHALGSLFLDGQHLITPQLEEAIDSIAKSFDGFYFGRFDLKAPDDEALKEGQDLRVMELNGLTSEATHIYDPSNSLLNAWGILCWQWRTAFEFGELNAGQGIEPTPFLEFLRDYRAACRRQRPIN